MPIATSNGKVVVTPVASERRDVAVIVEGVFAFVMKSAQRIVQLNDDEIATLRRLALSFASATDEDRTEIVEAVLEVVLPDDFIGGVAAKLVATKETQEKAVGWRLGVGDRIKKLREEKGWTQSDLADCAKIKQSHVSRLENGMHAPTHLTIERLAKALKVEPADLDPGYPD